MKTFQSGRALFFASVLLLTACDVNVEREIKPYVEAKVVLKADGASFKGTVPFTETHYFTNYRNVCDTVQCGYEDREVCETVPRCTGEPRSCHTDSVCHDEPDSVCHIGPGGEEVCTTTHRRECEDVERCTGGGESCTNDTVCHTEQVPRYCQENCREEPFQDSRKIKHDSAVTVTVSGGDASAISELVLGAKTTSAYSAIFHKASDKPKDLETLLKTLVEADKTLVVMRSKSLKLVDTSSFLVLPAGFKAGDPVNFELKVQSGADKSGLSAVGSTVDFPALNWSTSE